MSEVDFESCVGKELIVIEAGWGFGSGARGKLVEVLEYSSTGYDGTAGYLCKKGTNTRFKDWVGVESFFGEDYE
jgi:hypothetical protein